MSSMLLFNSIKSMPQDMGLRLQ